MKNLLTFEEFLMENRMYEASLWDSNPKDFIPFDVKNRKAYKSQVVISDNKRDPSSNEVIYWDYSKAIPKDRMSGSTFDVYVDEKLYLCKPVSEIWPLITKKLGIKVPPLPKRGFHEFPFDGDLGITVYYENGGRGLGAYSVVQLSFRIKKNENYDSNLEKIKDFIREECFYPNNTPEPKKEDFQ